MWEIYAYDCIQRWCKYWSGEKKEKSIFFSWKLSPQKHISLCGTVLFTIINGFPPIISTMNFLFFFLDPILRTSPKYIAHVGHFLLEISWVLAYKKYQKNIVFYKLCKEFMPMPTYRSAVNSGREKKSIFFLGRPTHKIYALCGPLLFTIINSSSPILPTVNFLFFFSRSYSTHITKIYCLCRPFFITNKLGISLQKVPKKYRV